MRRTMLWIVVALLGLVVAAGVTAAASRISSQRVGLASEPLSAGEGLAPASGRSGSAQTRRRARRTPAHKGTPATTTPSQGSTTAPTRTAHPVPSVTDDSGSKGKGSGKSGEGDD